LLLSDDEETETLCHRVLQDASFFALLLKIDRDLAEAVREAGCPECAAAVHAAHYPRKPRGGPAGLEPAYRRRFSFCCSAEGCRKRATPPSVRFLGRRLYLGIVVVLASTLLHGATPDRVRRLARELGVSRETIERWRVWWREEFPATPLWQERRGDFSPAVERSRLPASLLERFLGGERERLVGLLYFLTPLTISSAVVS
jgi:hypothetical protein